MLRLPFHFLAPAVLFAAALAGCDSPRNTTESANPAVRASSSTAERPEVSFDKNLNRGDYAFTVRTTGTGAQRQLWLRAERLGRELTATTTDIDGTVNDAVVTNLNRDDYPELLVFITDAGSGSYGRLVGYEFLSRGRRDLTLPTLEGPAAEGYQGHDSFRVDDRKIIRTFPIYRPDDPNSTPSGGTRTIEYEMPKKEGQIQVAGFADAM